MKTHQTWHGFYVKRLESPLFIIYIKLKASVLFTISYWDQRKMSKAMEVWVGEMKKLGEKINHRNTLMQSKKSTSSIVSKQQGGEEERGVAQNVREKDTTMSELTVCLLMDRFVPW
ncbi:uncharacterized protein BNACNNG66800D [Brassica napus]|nr:uncharacterized protein BNACNNG66800D [Brassica napus]